MKEITKTYPDLNNGESKYYIFLTAEITGIVFVERT